MDLKEVLKNLEAWKKTLPDGDIPPQRLQRNLRE